MTQRHGFLILPPFGLLSLSGAIDALLAANGLLERAAFDASVLTLDGGNPADYWTAANLDLGFLV